MPFNFTGVNDIMAVSSVDGYGIRPAHNEVCFSHIAVNFFCAVVAGFIAVFALVPSRQSAPMSALGAEYRLALAADGASIREMIRTQNADGSWKTDYLTKRNAAALKGSEIAEARVAYKKAMRNLRIRGVL